MGGNVSLYLIAIASAFAGGGTSVFLYHAFFIKRHKINRANDRHVDGFQKVLFASLRPELLEYLKSTSSESSAGSGYSDREMLTRLSSIFTGSAPGQKEGVISLDKLVLCAAILEHKVDSLVEKVNASEKGQISHSTIVWVVLSIIAALGSIIGVVFNVAKFFHN